MSRCIYETPWYGQCKQEAIEGSDFCEKHVKKTCNVCGKQATNACGVLTSLMCGAPLCDIHRNDCRCRR